MVEKSSTLAYLEHKGQRKRHTRKHAGTPVLLPALITNSPLRHTDPRAKLALSTLASLAVMMPLERMGIFMALYTLLLLWARLLPAALRQIWRLKVLLLALFVADWVFIGLDLAVIIVLRVILLTGVFAFFVSTTTPTELWHALVRLRLPYRYAFSLSLAFQSVGLLQQEWHTIREAQIARGAWSSGTGGKAIFRLRDFVTLTVPVIVLATRRAWAMTEAAYARGFDTPHRTSYRKLEMRWTDWLLVLTTILIVGGLLFV